MCGRPCRVAGLQLPGVTQRGLREPSTKCQEEHRCSQGKVNPGCYYRSR
jgi:hypothetical protein